MDPNTDPNMDRNRDPNTKTSVSSNIRQRNKVSTINDVCSTSSTSLTSTSSTETTSKANNNTSSSSFSSSSSFRLYHRDQVPPLVHELNIFSGYRFPKSSVQNCIKSAFSFSNETLNFWTHFLPLLYAIHQTFLVLTQAPLINGFAIDYNELPIFIYCLAVVGLLACSSIAHLFNSLSLKARQVFFFIDYAGISVYGAFTTISYLFLIRPKNFLTKTSFVWGANAIAIVCCASCCLTRKFNFPRPFKVLVRAAVTTVPYFFGSVPAFLVLYNVCEESCQELPQNGYRISELQERSDGSPTYFGVISHFASNVTEIQNSSCCGLSSEANEYFVSHARWFSMAIFMFTARVPERFLPGRFDFIGQSHQLFHICIAMGAYKQYQMLLTYYRAHRQPSPWPGSGSGSTLERLLHHNFLSSDGNNTVADSSTTIVSMMFVLVSLSLIIATFSACVDPKDGRCHSLECCWRPFPPEEPTTTETTTTTNTASRTSPTTTTGAPTIKNLSKAETTKNNRSSTKSE